MDDLEDRPTRRNKRRRRQGLDLTQPALIRKIGQLLERERWWDELMGRLPKDK